MKTKSTDKDILVKGIKQLGIALTLLILGPILLHLVLTNRERPFFYILLTISIIICCIAVIFIFKGINTILDSLFKSKKYK